MWLDGLYQDARYAVRGFVRSPLFALTAVLSIAIGIGADTAIFTIGNALLLRAPAGVHATEELVAISGTDDDLFGVNEISFPNFVDLRERATTLASVYAYEPTAQPMSLVGPDGAERVFGHRVTPNYFLALGVRATAGRLFDAASPTGDVDAVVLSYRFWMRRFNGDVRVIGSTVRLNKRLVTVAGVAAEGFSGTSLLATDVWVPLDTVPFDGSFLTRRDLGWALIGARLKPEVSAAQAAAEITAVARALGREYPETNSGRGLRLAGLSLIPGNLSIPLAGVLGLLLGFVSLVLVIACANLAGLLLTRGVARRREIAVRAAIGASRRRLLRQLITEVLLLFAAGGAGGALLAYALISVCERLRPSLSVPLNVSLNVDASVLAFTSGLSLVAALVCGIVPVRHASRTDVVSSLKDDAQATPSGSRFRNTFVICQVAGSVVLIAATALFARALQKTTAIEPGFDPNGVELAAIDLSLAGYTATTAPSFVRDLVARLRVLPRIEGGTAAAVVPTGGAVRLGMLTHPGGQLRGGGILGADWNAVEPDYFHTMRIPIVRGRDFAPFDDRTTPGVVIVSEQAARRFWPGQDPLGKFLLQHPTELRRGEANEPKMLTVIAVVGDVTPPARGVSRPQVYVPLQQHFVPGITLAARTVDGRRIADDVRRVITAADPNVAIIASETLEQAVMFSMLPRRIAALASAGLGSVGLLLAAMGVYGVAAFAVAERRREIGIRIALGASRQEVVRLVLGNAAALTLAGCVVGVAVAVSSNWALARVFSGFPAFDPVAFAVAVTIFATAAIAATYAPVRRALILDPVATLRCE